MVLEVNGYVSIKWARGDILFAIAEQWSSRVGVKPVLFIFLDFPLLNGHFRIIFEVVGSIQILQGIAVERAQLRSYSGSICFGTDQIARGARSS